MALMEAGMAKQAKHEQQLDEMHSALYALGDKARGGGARDGAKLLPSRLSGEESPEVAQAKKHIATLHGHFKAAKLTAEEDGEKGKDDEKKEKNALASKGGGAIGSYAKSGKRPHGATMAMKGIAAIRAERKKSTVPATPGAID